MRFLNIRPHGELTLSKDLKTPPGPYAILSHTWGANDDEVNFDDLEKETGKDKAGYTKLWFCANQARKDGLEYFWVDTCCIKKANPAELNEAITSMFRWYSEAAKCYVFLCDVSSRKRTLGGSDLLWKSTLRRSRWFTRGWTLQELLAPRQVEFYSREGDYLGDKNSLKHEIHETSHIPIEALQGAPLSDFMVAERLQWASKRNTSREEDQAYCLTGIFGVYMLPNYGEGSYAFQRLKNEIASDFRRQVDKIEQPWASSASDSMNRRIPESKPVATNTISVQDRRRALIASLSFDQMDSRQSTIKSAFSTTCKWFLEHSAYLDWNKACNLATHHGFLWLSGKPGAGKSTLMKFAHDQADKVKLGDEILIAFFFNARGYELEKSTVGMYRALLFQLLNQATDLQEVLDEFYDHDWTPDTLCELFLAAVAKLGQRQLKCFIDALDECDEQQIREMVVFFEELEENAIKSGTRLHMCFASRHYPAIDFRYGRQLILENEQGHNEDMAKYVQRHLRAGKGTVVDEVKAEIQKKANGVFLWVVLVVAILNDEFTRGRVFAVKKRLQEIPPRLSELFKDILWRDEVNMADLLLSLQWVLFAVRPLTKEEFYFAMVAGLDSGPEKISRWDPEKITADYMDRFVLSSSKGLAELTRSKKPTVQFIHESVRDYLIKDDGISELWPELGGNFQSLSHDRLKRCCENYLQADLSDDIPQNQPLPKAKSQSGKDLRHAVTRGFPFLEYASCYIWRHAENAVSPSTSQSEFLEHFPLATWISVSNLLQQYDIRRHTPNASLLYILAENNYPQLINSLPDQHKLMKGDPGERYLYPIFAAFANAHRDTVRALLSQDQGFSIRQNNTTIIDYAQGPSVIDATCKDGRTALNWASQQGWWDLVQLLIDQGANIEATDKNRHTALHRASEASRLDVVQLLVDKGANIETIDKNGYTVLHRASQAGRLDVVQLLVDKGANIEATDAYGNMALHQASKAGQLEMVQLLIEKGVNIEATDAYGNIALHRASEAGQSDVVQLLVDKSANIEATDEYGRTALHRASEAGQSDVVQLLVNKGANIEATDEFGRTALHQASETNHLDVMQLLVDNGANIEAINKDGYTALHQASKAGRLDVVQLLVDKSVNIEAINKDGYTALHWASQVGQLEVVRLLVDKGANIEAIDEYGYTALHRISQTGRLDVVQLLVDKGASIETTDKSGYTVLHRASQAGRLDVVQLLVDKGVNIEATDAYGNMALHRASEAGWSDVVQLLVDKGANIEATDEHGHTALHRASEAGRLNVVQLLVDMGVNIEAINKDKYTALHWASQAGRLEVVRLLVNNGVNIEATDVNGNTALHQASKAGWLNIVPLLMDRVSRLR